MNTRPTRARSDMSLWIEQLRAAARRKIIHSADGVYIKIRWWSPKRQVKSLTPKRVRSISRVVRLKVERADAKAASNKAQGRRLRAALNKGATSIGAYDI
jgi:hypothetical protein